MLIQLVFYSVYNSIQSAAPAPVKVESKPVVKMEQPRVEQETMINDWSVEQKELVNWEEGDC